VTVGHKKDIYTYYYSKKQYRVFMTLVEEEICKQIIGDLNPPLTIVIFKSSLAFTLSCLFSFIFCGQCGVTPTTLSYDVHKFLIDLQGMFFCSIVCGTVFTLVSTFILRALSTGVGFRVIIRKFYLVHMFFVVGLGFVFSLHGIGLDVVYYGLWLLSALGSFIITSELIHYIPKIVKQSLVWSHFIDRSV
jgi:hypothetical protein